MSKFFIGVGFGSKAEWVPQGRPQHLTVSGSSSKIPRMSSPGFRESGTLLSRTHAGLVSPVRGCVTYGGYWARVCQGFPMVARITHKLNRVQCLEFSHVEFQWMCYVKMYCMRTLFLKRWVNHTRCKLQCRWLSWGSLNRLWGLGIKKKKQLSNNVMHFYTNA